MTKFNSFDIESIKDCIREACDKTITDQLVDQSMGFRIKSDYKIRRDSIQEAERLIALMDSLKEEKDA